MTYEDALKTATDAINSYRAAQSSRITAQHDEMLAAQAYSNAVANTRAAKINENAAARAAQSAAAQLATLAPPEILLDSST